MWLQLHGRFGREIHHADLAPLLASRPILDLSLEPL
jgi:hypothetical protein